MNLHSKSPENVEVQELSTLQYTIIVVMIRMQTVDIAPVFENIFEEVVSYYLNHFGVRDVLGTETALFECHTNEAFLFG